MAPQRRTVPVVSGAQARVSVDEALSRLGMTQEQFQAKQAELLSVLLQNEPFVPQNTNTRQIAQHDRFRPSQYTESRSRSSSVSTTSSRAPSPAVPRTPVKPHHSDAPPPRPRDQMEQILEEKARRKESRRRGSTSRSRDDERVFATPSRGSDRIQATILPPNTPHHYKYYSERVVGGASSSKQTLDNVEVPETPSRDRNHARFKVPLPRHPMTPSRQEPSSSCPPTPRSSPPPEVNIVSSPAPMRPTPLEDDRLPFTLPPGPYSTLRPEVSYAAIIGRAILSSPGHALALQDIYEYITTVYPFYKRGEVTWMNSVRHALSTMAVFRKVQRGRAEGKSLWAIYDCDIPCFEGGGFKKALCADMKNSNPKPPRKRGAEEGSSSRSKRKKMGDEHSGSHLAMPAPVLPPFFPHFTSNPHHQPYYQAACQQQQVPAETLFPPLPPSSNYHRVLSRAASIPATDLSTTSDKDDDCIPSSPIERPPSSSSIPDLVSNFSSSSSPAPSSHPSLHGENSRDPSPADTSVPPATVSPAEEETDHMAAWLRSNVPLPLPKPIVSAPSPLRAAPSQGKFRMIQAKSSEKAPRILAPMAPPSSPTPEQRRKRSSSRVVSGSNGKSPVSAATSLPAATQVSTLHQPTSTTLSDAVRVIEQVVSDAKAKGSDTQARVDASALVEVTRSPRLQERPSTPQRPVTPPAPSTPSRSDLPSTPGRLAQLESELFDFSPFAFNLDGGHAMFAPIPPQSPSLSVFNARAPLLHAMSVEEFIAADPPLLTIRSPLGPPRTPRTPRRTPLGGQSSSLFRVTSPFGTPSRTMPREGWSELDEDLARFFQTPPRIPYENYLNLTPDASSSSTAL